MKIRHIFFVALCALVGSGIAMAKSDKRGVSCNNFAWYGELDPLVEGVTWYYNWGTAPNSNLRDYPDIEFIPMCWNGGFNAESIRSYCQDHPNCKYILGFNEPNFRGQANMTPQAAAERWPAVQALAQEFNLQIVSPALNYSPDAPYNDPAKWMDEFISYVGKDAFDFIAIHNYGGAGGLQNFAERFYERYGKPIWVTEFCYWPGESGFVAPSAQIHDMVNSLEYLEKSDIIYRYAWFHAKGAHDSSTAANFGLLIGQNGPEGPRELSDQGHVYVNLWDFDSEYYHSTGDWICAADFISREVAEVSRGHFENAPKTIEISSFNGGATLDYQFDVEEAGDYILELVVSGIGEPSRFDPSLSVVEVKADGKEGTKYAKAQKFTLTGSDTEYKTVSFAVSLPAGKQTIRLKDEAPYQPSGLRISCLKLSTAAGINGVTVDDSRSVVDVFTPLGVKVRSSVLRSDAVQGLPAGLYIVGSEKIIVK